MNGIILKFCVYLSKETLLSHKHTHGGKLTNRIRVLCHGCSRCHFEAGIWFENVLAICWFLQRKEINDGNKNVHLPVVVFGFKG